MTVELKSVNLQYDTLGRWVDGPNNSLTKRLMFQVLFFFIISYRLRALKTLYFYFCKVIKKLIERIFAKNFARNYEKKILGTSDAWSTSRLANRPKNPAYYIED